MYLPNQTSFYTYQYYLYETFRYIVSAIRLLPAAFASWLLVAIRVFFIGLLGFAAWIRSFSDTAFAIWFIIGLLICFLLHLYCGKPCFYPEEKCKIQEISDETTNEWLKNELQSQKSVCQTLEHVRAALESKTKLESQAEHANERWKTQVYLSERNAVKLQKQIEELNNSRSCLVQQLKDKIDENTSLKVEFSNKMDEMNRVLRNMRTMEENKNRLEQIVNTEQETVKKLQEENSLLKSTIEVLQSQRKGLATKHSVASEQVRQLQEDNKRLESQLISKDEVLKGDMERIEDLRRLTRRLQTSISTAKGKLTRVEGVLGSEQDKPRYNSHLKPFIRVSQNRN